MSNKTQRHGAPIFAAIVASALLIVAARCLSPFEVGKDQALQLEAALRLATGAGLTSTYDTYALPADISQPPTPKPLTWWPPIFSLLVAGLLKAGAPLAITLKLIYGTVTIIGWIGCGLIARKFLAAPLMCGNLSRLPLFLSRDQLRGKRQPRQVAVHYIGYLIAALGPVFFTLSWGGTDIFLWAGIPYAVILLTASANSPRPVKWIAGAGLLFGFLYGIRYASSFVGLATLLTLYFSNHPNWRIFFKQASIFLAGSMLTALPVVIYVRSFTAHGTTLPEYVDASYGATHIGETFHRIFNHLPVISNSVFGVPLWEELVMHKIDWTPLNYGFGLICLTVMLGLPVILFKLKSSIENAGLALNLSFLPIALVALLTGMVFITDQYMIEVNRYHEPIRFYTVMIYYGLACAGAVPRFVKFVSLSTVFTFLCYTCLYLPARMISSAKRDDVVRTVLGFTPAKSSVHTSTSREIGFPGNQAYSLKSNSREMLTELHRANPGAIFFVDNYPFYVYEELAAGGPRPGYELRRFPDQDFWQRAYTSQPLKIFWVMNQPGDPLSFVPPENRRQVFFDPYEKTVIFESDFPAGYKFHP